MTVKRLATTPTFIGAAADTKPTPVPAGSRFYAYDTGIWYVTYDDGTNWVNYSDDSVSVGSIAAGSAVIGKVGIDQTTPGTTDSVTTKTKGYAAKVSVTRTNDTNGYTANDVLGPATGSTAAITFANMGPSGGGEIIITSATFERDAAAIISGETSYTLHLYNVTPPSALGDNTAFDLPSGDRASYLGSISLGAPVDLGSTLFVATDLINKQITLASSSLFGYLVTVGGYTPAASAVHLVGLHSVGV